MDFIKNNIRAIAIAVLAVGIVAVIANSGDSTETPNSTDQATSSESTNDENVESENNEEAQNTSGDTEVSGEQPILKNEDNYSVRVARGDNQTKIIRRILEQYYNESGTALSAEQKLYTETNIVAALPRNNLIYAGSEIVVDNEQIEKFTTASKELTESQIAAWSKYL